MAGLISLPLFLYNCKKESDFFEEPKKEIIKEKSGKTNYKGNIYFTDNSTLEEVEIKVTDTENRPLQNINVNFTDGEGYEIFWLKDASNKYLPTLGIYAHNSTHKIKMGKFEEGIFEIYSLKEDDPLGRVVWKWRDKENMNFSEYTYEKTINYDEYLGIQKRGTEVVDFLWRSTEILLSVISPIKPKEIIEKLFPEEENPPQRWDFYNYFDGENKFFTLIPSNIPTIKIDSLNVDKSKIYAYWSGEDKEVYEKFVFLPDNKDLTKYVDGNSTSDLEYSYRIIKEGNIYRDYD